MDSSIYSEESVVPSQKTKLCTGCSVDVGPLGIQLTLTVLQPWSRKDMGGGVKVIWPVEREMWTINHLTNSKPDKKRANYQSLLRDFNNNII